VKRDVGRQEGGERKGTHFAGARLGQVRDDEDLLRRGEGANDLAHLDDELFGEGTFVAWVVFELAGRTVSEDEGRSVEQGTHGLRVTNAKTA
jgi:hypothetical protein